MNNFGCTAVDTILVIKSRGIEGNLIQDIAVYPNPNNGKFWLVYEFNSTTPQVVEVINVEGQTVWRDKMDAQKNGRHLIETEHLEQGIYYLKVIDGDRSGLFNLVIQ